MSYKISTPWGPADQVDTIAPGISFAHTPSHGGILLDAAHTARIPRSIETGYSGSRAAWEEDCDWAIPYLLFEAEFSNWGPVQREGADKVREIARQSIAYNPAWVAAIDKHLAAKGDA